ncbi:SMP-30/gluconolactonase/LRE family protein [Salinisphaera aquimarina]|uniref:SMP-30/gluconolactonase/LRE family protein n=1 Tax=Salinisphaera aquimarina TaxID=2094031 RepID=A0ABV7EP85_9GAMM
MTNSLRKIETLVDGLSFTEVPRWHNGRLWFVDFYTYRVLAVDPDNPEQVETVADIPEQPSGIGFLPDGDALLVSMRDRRLIRRTADGALSEYADLSALAPWHLNDMVVDSQGRAWVGNFGFDLMAGKPMTATNLIRVDPNGQATEVANGLRFPNGMVVAPDGNQLIVAETFGQQITAYDIGAHGNLSGKRAWAKLGPDPETSDVMEFVGGAAFLPDGICLDAEGAVWAADAGHNRVLRLAEGGEILDEISTGDMGVFACMLGGDDGRTLFMCTAPSFNEEERKSTREAAVKMVRVDVPSDGLP